MKIGIVSKGSLQMGMGHIFRQVNLMKRVEQKHELYFFINKDAETIKLLQELSMKYYVYNSVEDIISVLKITPTDLLIIDLLDTVKADVIYLNKYVKRIILFDDCGSGSEVVDYVINAIIPSNCQRPNMLCGKDYMIYNEATEFYANQPKLVREKVKRILVSFGGSDPQNYTGRLDDIFRYFDLIQFDVIIGPNYHEKKILAQQLVKNKNVNIIEHCNNIAKNLFEADLAIISGGLTLYESTYIGTPNIVWCQAAHQIVTAKRFADNNCCVSLDDTNETNDVKHVISMLLDYKFRKKMSNDERKYISENGIVHILDLICELERTL